MGRLEDMLRNEAHPMWTPFTGQQGWTLQKYHDVNNLSVSFMGHLIMRCSFPFQEWPFELGKAAVDMAPGERELLHADVRKVKQCCVPMTDGLTVQFARCIPPVMIDFTQEEVEYISDVMEMALSSNIEIEDRFARMRQHAVQHQRISTKAADHCLSEWRAMYSRAKAQTRTILA